MRRILLVDHSPHAQRMGERILSEEGYEVVTVSNSDSALIRLEDVDPDVVLADTLMPGRSGYEICHYVKMSPRHKHVRVILTTGVLETFDETEAHRVEADGTLKKPFEASALLSAVKPLAEAAVKDRGARAGGEATGLGTASPAAAPFVAVVDAEQIKAAVTVALDAAMDSMVEEITLRVLTALQSKKPEGLGGATAPLPVAAAAASDSGPAAPPASAPASAAPRIEAVRRVSPLRFRSSSILGLEIGNPEPEPGTASPEPRPPAADPQ